MFRIPFYLNSFRSPSIVTEYVIFGVGVDPRSAMQARDLMTRMASSDLSSEMGATEVKP